MTTEYTEIDRLIFIANRDGVGAAIDFAERGIRLFDIARQNKKHFINCEPFLSRYTESRDEYARFIYERIAL